MPPPRASSRRAVTAGPCPPCKIRSGLRFRAHDRLGIRSRVGAWQIVCSEQELSIRPTLTAVAVCFIPQTARIAQAHREQPLAAPSICGNRVSRHTMPVVRCNHKDKMRAGVTEIGRGDSHNMIPCQVGDGDTPPLVRIVTKALRVRRRIVSPDQPEQCFRDTQTWCRNVSSANTAIACFRR